MTKTSQLAQALVAGRMITRATALVAFKIANLTAEIATLRRRGYRIETIVHPDDGTGTPYTSWHYAGSTRAGSPATEEMRAIRRAKKSGGV
jgi:DNA-binding winged helix-turn-helix (wHTH) protein